MIEKETSTISTAPIFSRYSFKMRYKSLFSSRVDKNCVHPINTFERQMFPNFELQQQKSMPYTVILIFRLKSEMALWNGVLDLNVQ